MACTYTDTFTIGYSVGLQAIASRRRVWLNLGAVYQVIFFQRITALAQSKAVLHPAKYSRTKKIVIMSVRFCTGKHN